MLQSIHTMARRSSLYKNARQFGHAQEFLAAEYLRGYGLKLIQCNYQCRVGEIDLIMIDSCRVLVFVEVRFRRSGRFGTAIDSITREKQRKIRRTASHFLISYPQFSNRICRFDVIGISPSQLSGGLHYEWIKRAFE
ncbi:MAG: YraN family protein [Pseudohongiellaceae bacterium]